MPAPNRPLIYIERLQSGPFWVHHRTSLMRVAVGYCFYRGAATVNQWKLESQLWDIELHDGMEGLAIFFLDTPGDWISILDRNSKLHTFVLTDEGVKNLNKEITQ